MRVCGLQCVTTTGLYKMLLSSVESWDTHLQVYNNIICSPYSDMHEYSMAINTYIHAGEQMILEGFSRHSDMMPDCTGTEINLINCFSSVTSSTDCDYLLVECRDRLSVTQTPVAPGHNPPTGLATDRLTSVTQTHVITGSISPADLATDKLTSVTQTPVIKTSNTPAPTDMRDTESFSEDGDPIAVFAGVSVMMVVIIALVILLIVVLVWKKRKMHAVANRKDDNR